ncbi:hypothetical protein ACSBR1_002026 [Camellia fascicularis]
MAPTAVKQNVAQLADQLRLDGNKYFNTDQFGAAINAYTEAIALCPDVVVYWTNRAICHCKWNDWKKVEEDCIRAIQLDPNSIKAHYMLGRALLKKHEYSEGIKELKRVLDLGGRGANPP